MKILVVSDWFCKYAADLSCALSQQGHEVMLLRKDHNLEFGGLAVDENEVLERLGVNGVRVWGVKGRTRAILSSSGLRQLRAAVLDWAPDVVHAQENYEPRLM